MENEILLIPDKSDIERDAVANSWIKNSGKVLRVGKFWEHPNNINNQRVTIYGNDTFGLVLAQVIGVELMFPKDEIISTIGLKWTKRQIDILKLSEVRPSLFPTFIKPVTPKTFASKVYESHTAFLTEIRGLNPSERIIRSDIISVDSEVRAFILNQKILDAALYEGTANLDSAYQFLNCFLDECTVNLPKSYVLDLGYNNTDGWFIIEFNSSWGAGLNACNPDKVINGIREATINKP